MKLTNIFIKYCLKYFVAFIIILACCIPVAEVSYKIVKQQIIEKNQLKLKEGINIIDQNISKMFPVSYTHLDVYKRQQYC